LGYAASGDHFGGDPDLVDDPGADLDHRGAGPVRAL
jgi:hypothetical protein